MIVGFLLHSYGLISRMIIMQRPPVTTLYESILFVSFILVLFALIFEYFRRDTLGILIASIGGVFLHFIGFKYAADGDTLGVLVAVLNSNFWLSTHVTTITTGYGVSLVAGLMAHVYLIVCVLRPQNKKLLNKLFDNTYGLTLMGLFFTMFGTILGGIWADQSWGRFWGWDPKENGALLIVLWHLMMLHLRVSGLVQKIGYAYGVSLVNIIVALAWCGVNLLNVGLHSYGFTDNVATNLFLFIGFEIIFMTTMYFLAKKRSLNFV
jgi:ABC-type transport system involved in cytochrome c biogenesis permease subunit